MNEEVLTIRVDCDPSEQVPRRLWLEDRVVEIAEVLDKWLGSDHRYFKVRGDDGDTYILRHDLAADQWEMTLYRRADR
jgi:hypothetical protein